LLPRGLLVFAIVLSFGYLTKPLYHIGFDSFYCATFALIEQTVLLAGGVEPRVVEKILGAGEARPVGEEKESLVRSRVTHIYVTDVGRILAGLPVLPDARHYPALYGGRVRR